MFSQTPTALIPERKKALPLVKAVEWGGGGGGGERKESLPVRMRGRGRDLAEYGGKASLDRVLDVVIGG